MKKMIKNPRLIGFIFLLIGILSVLSNRELRLEHPVMSIFLIYLSGPIYLFLWIKSIIFNNKKEPVKENNLTVYQEPIDKGLFEQENKRVSHIEKRTQKVTTTTKTESEIIYFDRGEADENY